MGYLESLLGADERVIHVARHHWSILLANLWFHILLLILGAVLLAGGFFADQVRQRLALTPDQEMIAVIAIALIFVVFPIIAIVVSYIRWNLDSFIITNYRVIHTEGIFAKSVVDSSLEKVNDVLLYQSVFGRMFDYGNVEILTSSDIGVNRLSRIQGPVDFKRAMLDAKQAIEGANSGRQATIPELIAQLAELRDSGVLSEEEFQAQKQGLLRRLESQIHRR